MPSVELSAGTIEYQDTGPTGPVVVLLHGLAMDGSLWRHVVEDLRHDHRVSCPRSRSAADAARCRSVAARDRGGVEAEFLQALDLRDVTLVGNDQGSYRSPPSAIPSGSAGW